MTATPSAPKPEVLPPSSPGTALARLDVQDLLTRAVTSGAPVETLERLMALAKDVRAVQAREAWYRAMTAFQKNVPAIYKTTVANTGTFSYRYAQLGDVLAVAQPELNKLGLSIGWRQTATTTSVTVVCRVAHELGHVEESGETTIPIIPGDGRGANAAQRVGIAITYAKRYSLLGVLGLVAEDDPDANEPAAPPRRDGGAPPPAPAPAPGPHLDDSPTLLPNDAEGAEALERGQMVHALQTFWNARGVTAAGRTNWIKSRFKGEMDLDKVDLAELYDVLRAEKVLPRRRGAAS